MSTLSQRDTEHIFQSLRQGDVPMRGVETFAVGIDAQRGELQRQLDLAASGEGTIKFLRGGYGCGKTFTARLATLDAQRQGFATSFVVVSDNDLRFHRFDEVYRKVVTELGTASCPRGALGDILDRWVGLIEASLVDGGADPDADGFEARVSAELELRLQAMMGSKAPDDLVRVVQAIFQLKQQGDYKGAGSLLSWLSGSGNVSASEKKVAGVKGDIESTAALQYLRGILEIVKAAGYKGLLIVIDEAETILRMRTDSRHKSLNGIRQILDASSSYPGLAWLFTGTPDFYDNRRGVKGLEPLDARIGFQERGGFANIRQPQLRLTPFDKPRLAAVAHRLRELFPTTQRAVLERKVSAAFITRLVDQVTAGFRGDVGIVPRQFLREFVDVLDNVEQHPDYDPTTVYDFAVDDAALTPGERAGLHGAPPPPDEDDGPVPHLDAW